MFVWSLIAHAALGAAIAFAFTLYYVQGDSSYKVIIEAVLGIAGNSGGMFVLNQWLPSDDSVVRLASITSCLISFLLITAVLLFFFSHLIKDKDDKDIIRIRDILLGRVSYINKYYSNREKQLDDKLPKLEEREEKIKAYEENIRKKEAILDDREKYLNEELEKLTASTTKNLKIHLPENTPILLNKDYIENMPSYLGNIIKCINDIESCTDLFISDNEAENIDITEIRTYFLSIASYFMADIFGGNTPDVRVHFRVYDPKQKGYKKLVAVSAGKTVKKELTLIPYADVSMIKKSYECRRALIKSINSANDYESHNHSVWQDYMTYTFYDIDYNDIPIISFGISVKIAARYKKTLHLLNYFRIEDFLQNNIEKLNEHIDLVKILCGGE